MSESAAANALVTVDEVKAYLFPTGGVGTTEDVRLQRIINRASQIIEAYLGRELIVRKAGTPAADVPIVEYHSVYDERFELYLSEWPLISVASVYEDTARVYGSDCLLTVNTDYIVSSRTGKLLRVFDSGGATAWVTGFRTIKVTYTAGYVNAAALPAHLADAALDLCARMFKEAQRAQWGVSSASDAAGNWTRFGQERLPEALRDVLDPERRPVGEHTWERD